MTARKPRKNHAHGSRGKRMDRRQNSGAGEKCAEDRQAESDDDQRQIPHLQHAPPFLDLDRMQKRRCREPRHERGVLHRIPGPVTAPTEHVIRPPGADEIARG